MNLVPILLITSYLASDLVNTENSPPIVTTKYGKIEGLWKQSYGGRQYAAFEGIPYALPPIGELRFEEPRPASPWVGVWKATQINKCIQFANFTENIIGDEDCLYLNVYVPETNKKSKELDVVVHIHGGGFFMGYYSEWTNEKYIMDRNVIYVTMHYRLAALGFLSTGDSIVPGNNGLKDQNLAMKWIKDNIEAFGGTSDSITLTGFSAGAASVHFHYLSPLSRNLFNRGMSMSGSAINGFALQKNSVERAKTLGKALGCDATDNRAMIACMKTRPAYQILKMTNDVIRPHPSVVYCDFAPVIEPASATAFLSEHPYSLLKRGEIYNVPWIASSTTHEGLMDVLPLYGQYNFIDENWDEFAKYFFYYDGSIPEHSQEHVIAEKIRKFYFPDGQIDETKHEAVTKVWTDRVIVIEALLAAKMQSKLNKAPVYVYQFGYSSRHSFKASIGLSNFTGACHGDDMPYFLGGLIVEPLTEEEIKLQNIGLDALYSYAHNGKPVIPGVTWSPLGKDFNYLRINGPDDITMQIKRDYTTENFWNSLGLLENGNLFVNKDKAEL